MAEFTERRRYGRSPDRADLVYTLCGKNEYANAVMMNCSPGGMYLVSSYPLDPDRELCIKFLGFPALLEGRVVWCRETPTPRGKGFGAGIRYPVPVVI